MLLLLRLLLFRVDPSPKHWVVGPESQNVPDACRHRQMLLHFRPFGKVKFALVSFRMNGSLPSMLASSRRA